MLKLATVLTVVVACIAGRGEGHEEEASMSEAGTDLGNFSVSLAVKDIKASKAFYEKLGFKEVGGKLEQNWLILQNETATVGLFQGMFEKNIFTFNPGWNRKKETLPSFTDVRELQAAFEKKGVKIVTRADPATRGPASFVIADPDGNTILFDQHVPAPSK